MKTEREYYDSVIKKADAAMKKRKKAAASACCAAVVLTAAITAAAFGAHLPPVSEAGTSAAPFTENAGIIAKAETSAEAGKAEAAIETENAKSGGDTAEVYGGDYGITDPDGGAVPTAPGAPEAIEEYLCIPAPAVTGDAFSKTELKEYITQNAASIASALRADSVVGGGELKIFTTGYCHMTVRLNENLMPVKTELNRDFVTVPVMRGDEIIADVTVYRVNGEIFNSVAYGGDGFRKLTAVFKENPGAELAFGYFGEVPEVIATPENKVYFRPSDAPHIENYHYYDLMKTPYNTFSLAELNNPDNYIVI